MKIDIYPASKSDAGVILDLIIELAEYEKARHEVAASLQDIEDSLFGPDAKAETLICSIDGQAVGYAIFFTSYSTWLGKNGIYLEDLYIAQKFRHAGAGKALLGHIARLARERKCGRLEWSVLDWNQPAIDFYRSIGALPQEEWVRYRLDDQGIEKFATAQ
ncbi:GNAT family N-acetyltransferase [Affinibrenneria salicis]|uniref:GNAT family N-acetyltransferase n=1 Tax=Affinibrenneria salicis TaxID=2590031 RepID=A0A5J5FWW6_9GAMM|nr:GNAT family N-acetyltransferase [Affinibrenneria salicis]KAA8998051.1 GNAT family N-acetyltransferase [Affinibrenneria salicis]